MCPRFYLIATVGGGTVDLPQRIQQDGQGSHHSEHDVDRVHLQPQEPGRLIQYIKQCRVLVWNCEQGEAASSGSLLHPGGGDWVIQHRKSGVLERTGIVSTLNRPERILSRTSDTTKWLVHA